MSMEYQVDIGGTMYNMEDIQSVTIERPLFDKFSPGNACSAEINIQLWPKSQIPVMARIVPYCKDSADSEWQQLGIFFIDTREYEADTLHIVGYDSMLRSETLWNPDQSLSFPMSMREAAEAIARDMGTTLDERCAFTSTQTVDYPADYTMREVLCGIAGANLGNWIVTAQGELLLVPLFDSAPPETHYLVTEYGNPITLAEVRILI